MTVRMGNNANIARAPGKGVEAQKMNIRDRIPEELRKEALDKVLQLSRAKILKPYRTQRVTNNGTVLEGGMTSTDLVREAGQMYAILTTERAKEANNRGDH